MGTASRLASWRRAGLAGLAGPAGPVAWAALALALLTSSPGCARLERLDKQSGELLDRIDDPGPTRSSSSGSSSRAGRSGSGLSMAQRSNIPVRMIKDARGDVVEIWGESKSTSTTPGHDATMEAKAMAMALSGEYEYITLQRSWSTATGGVSKSRRIPDLIGVRRDGKVDAFEIESDSDDVKALMERLEEGRRTLPLERRGHMHVGPPLSALRIVMIVSGGCPPGSLGRGLGRPADRAEHHDGE